MDYTVVSEKIAFDGVGFSCRLCGKASYRSMAAVKGHLSRCPNRLGGASAEPQLAAASPAELGLARSLVVAKSPAELELASQPVSPANPYTRAREPAQLAEGSSAQFSELNQRVEQVAVQLQVSQGEIARLQNEYSHVVQENVLAKRGSGDWFQQNKTLVLVVGAFLLAFMLFGGGSRECTSQPAGGRAALSDIKGKLVTKLVDKGTAKVVDKVLKLV